MKFGFNLYVVVPYEQLGTGRPVKESEKLEVHLRHRRLGFDHQVLVANSVDEAVLSVAIMDVYGFVVDFKKRGR